METPSEEQLRTARRFPWQWAVYILMGVAGSLFTFFMLRVNKGDETCEQRIVNLQKAIAQQKAETGMWQGRYINLSTDLLIKNDIIDRQQTVINHTDSIARQRLEKPAKQILKANE